MTDNDKQPCGWMWVSPAGEKQFRVIAPEADDNAAEYRRLGWRVKAVVEIEAVERREARAVMRTIDYINEFLEEGLVRVLGDRPDMKKNVEQFGAMVTLAGLRGLFDADKSGPK